MADRGSIAKTAEPSAASGGSVAPGTGFAPSAAAVTSGGGATVFAPTLPARGVVLTGSAGTVTVTGSANTVVVIDG